MVNLTTSERLAFGRYLKAWGAAVEAEARAELDDRLLGSEFSQLEVIVGNQPVGKMSKKGGKAALEISNRTEFERFMKENHPDYIEIKFKRGWEKLFYERGPGIFADAETGEIVDFLETGCTEQSTVLTGMNTAKAADMEKIATAFHRLLPGMTVSELMRGE